MAFTSSTAWEVRSTGASTNGGGFDVGNANFTTDLQVISGGTGNSPVVASASYTFVSTDCAAGNTGLPGNAGPLLFIKTNTNGLIPGFYPAISVSGGQLTLNASIGAVQLYGGATLLNTVAGCAGTATVAASGTWGMDYTQQSGGLALTSVAGTGSTITSSSPAVGVNWVGNIINMTSTGGFTAQRVQVTSVSAGTATVDKAVGGTSGGAGVLGGALDGFVTVAGAMIASNLAFVSGSFTQSAVATFSQSNITPTHANPYTHICGYGAYRGDGGKATITLSSASVTVIQLNANGQMLENVSINCAAYATSIGIATAGSDTIVRNCRVMNYTSKGISVAGGTSICRSNEVFGGSGSATAGINLASAGEACDVLWNYVHDNVGAGISCQSSQAAAAILGNIVSNNTGAGIIVTGDNNSAFLNTVFSNGSHGMNNTSDMRAANYTSNLLVQNGGYGLVLAGSAGYPAGPEYDGNAYYLNASGTRNNANDLGAVNPINGVAPYVNVRDIILSANPFVRATASVADGKTNTVANQFGSTSYTFVTGDIGATIFILNTTGGWTGGQQFMITSVSSGYAVLNASPGASSISGATWHFDNYQLNTTAGGGAACTGTGVPAQWLDNASTISYPSMGAVQPQNTGGGGMTYIFNVES